MPRKIRTKFLAVLVTGITVGMSALIILSSRTQFADAEKAAFYAMVQEAKSESELASAMLDRALVAAQGMANTARRWSAEDVLDRERIIQLMHGFLSADPAFLGTASVMEASDLDGRDTGFRIKSFPASHDRSILYYAKGPDGIRYEPLDMADKYATDTWYGQPQRTQQATITEPYIYPVSGKDVWMTTASAPLINAQGRSVGVFTIDVALDSIQAAVAKIRPYGSGWAGILSADKQWVAAQNADLLGRTAQDAEADQVTAVTSQGEIFQAEIIDPSTGKLSMVVAVPIKFSGAPEVWSFIMVAPSDAVMQSAIQTRNSMLLIGLVILGVSLVGVIWFASTISDPIRQMTGVMNRLADGDNQVDVPAQDRQDEIGEMSKAVLVFKENAIERARLEREQDAVKKELKYRAYHDPLTGLFNRFALADIEQDWLSDGAPPFVLLYLDLDNFKNINDAFGHACGDMILSEVASRLSAGVPENSTIVRYGGDEFAVFVRDGKGVCQDTIGADIVQSISMPYLISNMTLHIGASVGISLFPKDDTQLEGLMIAADLAMRVAKRKKNSYAFFSPDMQEAMRRKISIEYQLRYALERNEIHMLYQPQIAADGSLFGVEALVRWQNHKLGSVPPDQFVAVAEETGQIIHLGDYIAQKSCEEFAHVLKTCGLEDSDLTLSVNISVSQFREGNFKEKILSYIEASGLSNHQVTIEITESLFIDEPEVVLPLLHDIRSTGIKVSLDDFGTGYSSLSTLRTLPIDELKVDKAFIDNICAINEDAEMTRAIIEMGHTMKTHIVSEGVETPEQVVLLRHIGCDVFQGYHFSKPLRKDDLIAFLLRGATL